MTTVNNEAIPQAEPTIQTVAHMIQDMIDKRWQAVLAQHQEQLSDLYDQAGEPAYGRYAQLLLRPVQAELTRTGFRSAPPFPGTLGQSREWGPAEERARWMWSALSDAAGRPIGTLVLCLYHDHTRFRVPRAARVLGLEVTDRDAIVEAVARAAGAPVADDDTTNG